MSEPDACAHHWKTARLLVYPDGHHGDVCRIEECQACKVRRLVRWRDDAEVGRVPLRYDGGYELSQPVDLSPYLPPA